MGYALQIRVRYAECDLQGVVFNANYLVYVDDIIERWLTTALPAGDLDYMVKKATVNLIWTATEVNPQTNAITPLLDQKGQTQLSRLQQSDFLNRASHDDRLKEDASAPRQASR